MGIVLGFVSLLCMILLLLKTVARKLEWERANGILWKIHKPICVGLVVGVLLHVLCILPVLENRSKWVQATGFVAVIFIIAIILFCHIIKKREQKLRWHRILSVGMLIAVVCHMVVYIIDFKDYQTKVGNIQIDGIDAVGVVDGNYIGKCDVGYICAEVAVTVKNEKITNIEILQHKNERGESAEKIVDEIIKEQRSDVDVVTGATNSSNVIKKAVEEALQN